MKRIVLIVVVVAALAGLGLWTLRFLGESRIGGQLDLAKAGAEARGWALTWGAQETVGFPLADGVRLTDVAPPEAPEKTRRQNHVDDLPKLFADCLPWCPHWPRMLKHSTERPLY